MIVIDIIKILILAIVTYLFVAIISNDNKRINIMGAIMLSCSSAVFGFCKLGIVEILISGQLILICLNRIFSNNSKKSIYIFGLFGSILGYGLLSSVSFQIAMAFVIVPLAIWIILKNRSSIEISKNQIILTVCAIFLAIILCMVTYELKPLNAVENENGLVYLMSYVYSPMIPFNEEIKFIDSNAVTNIFSIFPVVLIFAIYYAYKHEKHMEFLAPTIISSILGIISISGSKLIFENLVPNYIIAFGVELLQLYMMLYIFSNIEEKVSNLMKSAYISLATIVFVFIIKFPECISDLNQKYIPTVIIVMESFILINFSDKRFVKLASIVFPAIVLFESIGRLIVNFM